MFKHYRFIDTIEGVRREITVRASCIYRAYRVAGALMNEPACVGWSNE